MRLARALVLDQFQKYSVCRGWVNKCYERAARAHARLFVNKTRAAFPESLKRRAYVVNAHGYVMKAGAALSQKFRYRRILARGLQKLYARFPHGQHGHAHALPFDLFRLNYLKSQRIAPEPESFLNLPRSDA